MKSKNNSTFNLASILIIVAITSIISAITAGVIVYNNNKLGSNISLSELSKDKDLNDFLEVYASITSEYYEDINKKEMLQKAISAMMNYLGDDYTTYLNTDNTSSLESELSGKYVGIGVSINNEQKTITKVYDDTPAKKAGIQEGDIIIEVNNEDVTSLSGNEVVTKIKSNKDTFTLGLKRGEEKITVTLKNESIIAPNIDYKILDNTKTGYIYIKNFSNTLETQVKKALNELEPTGMTSLIIDLRDNTGGFLNVASDVSSMFLEKGKMIYSLSDKTNKSDYYDETEEKRSYPIVVLVNENTASASEIMAMALKESYGATIVGEKSFGKGKVQQIMKLDGGSMVKYTSAYWLTPSGNCIDEIGISPDYVVTNEEIKDAEGNIIEIKDNQLEKATNLLNPPV